jgi:hypothetical protein
LTCADQQPSRPRADAHRLCRHETPVRQRTAGDGRARDALDQEFRPRNEALLADEARLERLHQDLIDQPEMDAEARFDLERQIRNLRARSTGDAKTSAKNCAFAPMPRRRPWKK